MSQVHFQRPQSGDHHPYFSTYIDLVQEEDILRVLGDQTDEIRKVLGGLSEQIAQTIHPPYQWTLVQMLGHCIDTERVFGYRIGRMGAGDPTPLVGFDQNEFVANSDYTSVSMECLIEEFIHLRQSHVLMLERFSQEMWNRDGQADGSRLTVGAGAYILAGHIRHHLAIARKRLGLN